VGKEGFYGKERIRTRTQGNLKRGGPWEIKEGRGQRGGENRGIIPDNLYNEGRVKERRRGRVQKKSEF